MTNTPRADADEALTYALGRSGRRFDPEPDGVAAAAIAAYGLRAVDAKVAALTYDSCDPDQGDDPVQGGLRRLKFEGHGLTVEVEVGADRALVGHLAPPRPVEVSLRRPGGGATVPADDVGRFAVPAGPPGPVSLRCAGGRDGAPNVVTDWFLL